MLVDDHAMFAETLGQYLRLMFKDFEIMVVTSAEKAREQSSRHNFDVVLIDLEMADCSGLTLLADFAAAMPSPACIVVSMHIQALWIERALKAGACGYVAKDSPQVRSSPPSTTPSVERNTSHAVSRSPLLKMP